MKRAAAALAGALACTGSAPGDDPAPQPTTAPVAATPPPTTVVSAALAPILLPDAAAYALARADLAALTPVAGGGPMLLEGTARGASGEARVEVALATLVAPRAHRRRVAFYRLAHAIGSTSVPVTVERRIPLGVLGRLLDGQRDALESVRARAAVQNDGRVDAAMRLVTSGREVTTDGYDANLWAGWAAAASPVSGEQPALVRGYVEMVLIDYLSAHVRRQRARILEGGAGLSIVDEGLAFPLVAPPGSLDGLLRRLRAVMRFPRGLRSRLAGFDRASARALLAPGAFETWLIPPRALIEIDERRVAVLSLLDAKIAEHGEAVVESL